MLAIGLHGRGDQGALLQGLLQRGHGGQRHALRIVQGLGVGGHHLVALAPGARAHAMPAIGHGKQFQRTHLHHAIELEQGGQYRNLQPQMVSVGGHLYQVL
jgi:hypothetical protein